MAAFSPLRHVRERLEEGWNFFWLISSSARLLMRYQSQAEQSRESNDEWSDVELVQPVGQAVPYKFVLSKLWHSELDLRPDDRSHCARSCLG